MQKMTFLTLILQPKLPLFSTSLIIRWAHHENSYKSSVRNVNIFNACLRWRYVFNKYPLSKLWFYKLTRRRATPIQHISSSRTQHGTIVSPGRIRQKWTLTQSQAVLFKIIFFYLSYELFVSNIQPSSISQINVRYMPNINRALWRSLLFEGLSYFPIFQPLTTYCLCLDRGFVL